MFVIKDKNNKTYVFEEGFASYSTAEEAEKVCEKMNKFADKDHHYHVAEVKSEDVKLLYRHMPEKVKEQILDIRNTGLTNMFDIENVINLALERNYGTLVRFLNEHLKEYFSFIMYGEER